MTAPIVATRQATSSRSACKSVLARGSPVWSTCARGRKPSWIACWVSEYAPEMIACDAMTVASVAKSDQRIMRPVGRKPVERIFERRRIGHQQRALSEIVEHQSRQHDAKPGEPDRSAAEMAHVGIHRLAAGHGQECCAEHRKADQRRRLQEIAERVAAD